MVVGLGLTASKARISDAQYQAMATAAKTAVGPDTELVDPGDVDHAKLVRDADQLALALAALNTAAGVADAMAGAVKPGLSRLGKRIAIGEKSALRGKSGEIARADVGGGHEVKVTGGGIERCSSGPCPIMTSFWENSLERNTPSRARLEAAAQKARIDPVWAARDAAAIDRALQSITATEFDLWAAAIPDEVALAGDVKFISVKRRPEQRADIPFTTPSPEKLAIIEKNVADMKADGRLPVGYKYSPPPIPGAVIPRDLATKAKGVIGVRLNEHPGLSAAWADAASSALGGEQLTKENYVEMYKSAAGRFWNRVGNSPSAKAFFVAHGFVVDGKSSPYLDIKGIARQEVSVGLDHMNPKATGQNYKYALDADKIQLLFQADNTKLSHLEKKDPTLRRP
jgi:hypothetical protein